MKRLFLGVMALGLCVAAVAFSSNLKTGTADLSVERQERNPWTSLRLNNDPADFQFAIVSDRTGGHRARVFSQAVEQLNLLQPEFVLSVGDLIEGYKEDRTKLTDEWREFQGYVSKLQMPFFYLPGNHDLSNPAQVSLWGEKFGRRYYHFVYRNVLFLLLNSDDPNDSNPHGIGQIGKEQLAYVKRALDENPNVRWTIVALHRPLWDLPEIEQTGWLAIEKLLAGRPYTVFAGHIHRYKKYVRQGQNYYQLATTGGASKVRGVRYGEFDHLVWVTMKKDGPVLANLLLDGIYTENMKRPVTDETGVPLVNPKVLQEVRGKVYFEGSPAPNALVTFYLMNPADKKLTRTADGMVEADGSFLLSTYAANDGVPVGEYAVSVVWWDPLVDENGKPGPNLLPAHYATPEASGLRAQIKPGVRNEIMLSLKK
jgi:hypothetical protein